MKKLTSKLIAIVLSMTLVFTMSGVAFADVADGTAVNPETAATAQAKAINGPTVKTPVKITAQNEGFNQLPIKELKTSADALPNYDNFDMIPDDYFMFAVTAPTTGYIWFDYSVSGGNAKDVVVAYVCEKIDIENNTIYPWEELTVELENGTTETNAVGIYAKKGTTYYLFLETPVGNTGIVTVKARAKMFSNVDNRTLPAYTNANKYMLSSGINIAGTDTSTLYYKVEPDKTGLMTVNLKSYGTGATKGTVTLYNKNKVALSTPVQYSSAKAATKAYFGVKKGVTYYIKVQNCIDSQSYYYPKYGVRYGVTAYEDRAIGTTSSAKKLTKGAAVTKTLFTATNSTGTDVYKIYVPSKQTTKFTINTQNIRSGNITVKVYKYGKLVDSAKTIYPNHISNTYSIKYGTTSGKATKGTYYIKVIKGAKVSGQYSIKYNK